MKMYKSAITIFVLLAVILSGNFSYSQKSSVTGSRFKPNSSFKRKKPMNYINHLALNGGFANVNYFGDLCNGLECYRPLPSFGGGLEYRFNESLMFRSSLNYVRLSGKDEISDYPERGLSFVSNNLDFSIDVVYDIFEFNKMYRRRPTFSPYIAVGLGFVTINPKVEYDGKMYNLRQLQTEGVKYSPIALTIPYGIGIRYKLHPHTSISGEGSWRYVFSDYVDDVSGRYDPAKKDLPDDDISKILSDRRNEHGRPESEMYKGIRGGKGNDVYFMWTVKISHTFRVTRQRYNINSHNSKFRLIRSIQTK